jgi:hypothetical protein
MLNVTTHHRHNREQQPEVRNGTLYGSPGCWSSDSKYCVREFGCDLSPHFKWVKFALLHIVTLPRKATMLGQGAGTFACFTTVFWGIIWSTILSMHCCQVTKHIAAVCGIDTALLYTLSKIHLGVDRHQIVKHIVTSALECTRFYFEHTVGNHDCHARDLAEHKGHFIHNVAYSKYDVPSEIICMGKSNTDVHYQITWKGDTADYTKCNELVSICSSHRTFWSIMDQYTEIS